MSIIKEFREFFLRENKVNAGTKADQEVGFPVKNQANTCSGVKLVFNRLLANHIYTDSVIQKLLESIAFKLNVEDTATTTEQGLVKVALDSAAYLFPNPPIGDFTTVPKSYQLPQVYTGNDNIIVTLMYVDITTGIAYTSVGSVPTGNNYRVRYDVSTISGILSAETVSASFSNNAITGTTLYNSLDLDTSVKFKNEGDVISHNSYFANTYVSGTASINYNIIDSTSSAILGTLAIPVTSTSSVYYNLITTMVRTSTNKIRIRAYLNDVTNGVSTAYYSAEINVATNMQIQLLAITDSAANILTIHDSIFELKLAI